VKRPRRSTRSDEATCTELADKHQGPNEGLSTRRRQRKKSSGTRARNARRQGHFFLESQIGSGQSRNTCSSRDEPADCGPHRALAARSEANHTRSEQGPPIPTDGGHGQARGGRRRPGAAGPGATGSGRSKQRSKETEMGRWRVDGDGATTGGHQNGATESGRRHTGQWRLTGDG
jgi:hypothetical protein